MDAPASNQNPSEALKHLSREQVYLCIMKPADPMPEPPKSRDEMRMDHHRYLVDLERRGVLFGAGRLINQAENETTPLGQGMLIIRAKTRAEAEALAFEEPYTKAGMRVMTLAPWQRNEGSVDISIRFADGAIEIDHRTYDLVPRKG